ncbi:MAG: MFS transporter [Gammaproteobacteria bacterium]
MAKIFFKSVLPLFCVLIIDAMSFGLVIPVLGPMLLEPTSPLLSNDTPLNMRTLYYSLCLGLPMAFMFIGAPLLGDISDQIGRKKALLIAMVGITLSCLISASGVVIGSVFLLLAGRCVLGFMDSSESVAKAAIADISDSPKQKVMNLSLASLAGTAGFVLGPLAGGFLANSSSLSHSFGFLTPFLVAAILSFLNALLLFFLFNETYTPKEVKKIRILNSFINLAAAFTDKRIRLLAIVFFSMQFAWGTYFQSISILLVKAFHFNAEKNGMFLSFLSLCFVVTFSVIIGILLRFFARRTIVIVSLFLVSLSCLLISSIHHEMATWISVVPMSIGIGLGYNTILSLFSEAVDKDSQGRIMGAAVGIFSIAWVISSLTGGLLSSINLYLPYMLASAVALVGWFGSFYLKKV